MKKNNKKLEPLKFGNKVFTSQKDFRISEIDTLVLANYLRKRINRDKEMEDKITKRQISLT